MQHSAEVRWFHRGAPGAATRAWFADGRTLDTEVRTDRYLLFPGCESGGVKLRSYEEKRNFEIKLRQGEVEPLPLPSGVFGRADRWVKWSCGETAVEPLVAAMMASPGREWVDVEKTRWLRRYSAESGAPVEVHSDVRLQAGAGVELTLLVVRGEPWWTFALEAFGAPEGVRATLAAAARGFLAGRPPVDAFTTENSRSYPAWLASL